MAEKKIALVTGAKQGLGLEISRQLGRHGFAVVLADRDEQVQESAVRLRDEALDAQAVVLDVTVPASIANAAQWLENRYPRLDVLVNNAGRRYEIGLSIRPSQLTLEMLRATFDVNFFGSFAVTQLMLPLLRKSVSARIINQSSTLGSLSVMSDPHSPYYRDNLLGYNASKTALNALTLALAKDLAGEHISVNAVCPGWVKTSMGTDAAPRTVEQGAVIAVRLATMEKPPTGRFLDDEGEIRW
jgi:NAD(P)-dependent dehydrogenase (short-subunit alcohol dehydrogenase family)